ncbi:MAG: STAS domain-containing protein [Zoogloea sp.]|nr:STAS domain-containing protein [Zoogloea sp.]
MNAQTEAVTPFVADPELTIYHAEEARAHLLQALEERPALTLDLSNVSEIDTAGIQLLVMARREAERLKKPMAVVAASQAVREVADFFNLSALIGLPPAADAVA